MAGTEQPNHDGQCLFYTCDCGEETEYGIYRWKNHKEWAINSCCGGCNSANEIKYCPYCGKEIKVEKK